MSLGNTRSLCAFYHTGGESIGAGCTKEYLDSVNGDLSTVMNHGAAVFTSPASIVRNKYDTGKYLEVEDAAFAAKAIPGLCALWDYTRMDEIDSVEGNVSVLRGAEDWYQKQTFMASGTFHGFSTLGVSNTSGFTVGQNAVIHDANSLTYHTLQIYAIVPNVSITVMDDTPGSLSAVPAYGYIAPSTPSSPLFKIGGAYNDFQSLLDDQSAYYYDQWVFIGSDLAPSSAQIFTSLTDGSSDNNTRLNIVGYLSNAYDCLPSGYGYFSETIGDGSYYKNSIARAKIGNDVATQTATMRRVDLMGAATWGSIFQFNDLSENVNFMGLCFYGTTQTQFPIQMHTGSYGSIHVNHCVHLVDNVLAGAYGMIRLHHAGSGGSIHDCYIYNNKVIDENEGLDEVVSHFDISHCCLESTAGFVHQSYNSATVHHCIIKGGHTPIAIIGYGHLIAFNNVFYCEHTSVIDHWSMAVLHSKKGSMIAYNNIYCADLTADTEAYRGIIRIVDGGELRYWDYNLIYDLDGNPWPQDKKLYLTEGYNSYWKGEYGVTLGVHDTFDKDPLFVDPANWDFRLRPGSPCLEAGRPDSQGNPTDIGLNPKRSQNNNLYGNNVPLYGN